MDKEVLSSLKKISGEANIIKKESDKKRYFSKSPEVPFEVVCPGSTDEVQSIVRLASDKRLAIFTVNDGLIDPGRYSEPFLLLDFSRMNSIENVDAPNLMAKIERGVRFSQLRKELIRHNLKPIYPAAATSDFVLPNYVNRTIMLAAQKFSETQFSNLEVVLADGSIHRTGSHALSEVMADWRDEPGPHLSKWYHAAQDIYGIVTKGSVLIYPCLECREVLTFDFKNQQGLLDSMKEISRKELCIECIGMNSIYLSYLVGKEQTQYRWIMLIGFESTKRHVEFQKRNVVGIAKKYGGAAVKELEQKLKAKLDEPWYVHGAAFTSFYTLFKHTNVFESVISKTVTKYNYPALQIARFFVSYGNGRAVYCGLNFLADRNHEEEMIDELNSLLLDEGAFFDRPTGEQAERVYSRTGNYLYMMKRIKGMVDPLNILNPGQPVPLV